MDAGPGESLQMMLPLPESGRSVRVRRGELEIHAERASGGMRLEVDDGLQVQRHFVGLPGDGRLELHTVAPAHGLLVRLRDEIAVAAGGRLRGYVTVPAVQRLVLRRADGATEPLLDFPASTLRVLWAGDRLGHAHPVPSRFELWFDRVPRHGITVPLLLRNGGPDAWRPFEFAFALADAELRELRGRTCAAPRMSERDRRGESTIATRGWPRVAG
jgi:hypothetical protein